MAWLGTWGKRRKITIDQSLIDSALSNFPVMIRISALSGIDDDDISDIFDDLGANSLKIAVTRSDGTTQCYVEIEHWDNSGELAILWVNVPSISDSVDTELYIYYDNSEANNSSYVGVTGSAVAQNVWNSNYISVWHMNQDPSGGAPQLLDSCSLDADGTSGGSMTSGDLVIESDVGPVIDFETDDYFDCGAKSEHAANTVTIESLIKVDNVVGNKVIVHKGDGSVANRQGYYIFVDEDELAWGTNYGGSWKSWVSNNANFSADQLYWVASSVEVGAATPVILYKNNAALTLGTSNTLAAINPNDRSLKIGAWKGPSLQDWFYGRIGEIRISNVIRPVGWIKAGYYSIFDLLLTYDSVDEYTTIPPTTLVSTTLAPTTLAPTTLLPTTLAPSRGVLIGGKLVNNSILFGRLVQ